MIRLMAEYRIKEGSSDIVQTAVKEFVEEIHEAEPETEYTSFRIGESDRFIHLMAFVDEASQERHQKANYTSRFVEVLYPNCVELPVFTQLNVVE